MILTTSPAAGVAIVTIDRPERRNALDIEHCRALHQAISEAAGQFRVVVLTGSGSAFCAGADLQEAYTTEFRSALRRLLGLMGEIAVPVVSAVNGPALGAGTQLVIFGDLCVAGPGARFGIPAAKLGLATDHWTARRLVHLVGGAAARLVLLTGEELDAEAALACGLAHRAGSLDEAVAWAGRIARLAPLTLAAHKRALRPAPPPDDPAVIEAVQEAWGSEDFVEGLAAFRERRAPRFEGR